MSEAPAPRRPERFTLLLVVGVAVVLLVLLAAGIRTWRDLAAHRAREAALQQQIQDSRQRIETLRSRIRRLRDNPDTLERLAREELGWVRPGDVVVVFPEKAEGRRQKAESGEAGDGSDPGEPGSDPVHPRPTEDEPDS